MNDRTERLQELMNRGFIIFEEETSLDGRNYTWGAVKISTPKDTRDFFLNSEIVEKLAVFDCLFSNMMSRFHFLTKEDAIKATEILCGIEYTEVEETPVSPELPEFEFGIKARVRDPLGDKFLDNFETVFATTYEDAFERATNMVAAKLSDCKHPWEIRIRPTALG